MKFTWKKVFGSLTGNYEPPVKPCPICCVNCTPACEGYPDCDFPAGCVCGGDGIAVYGAGPNICYCCKEITTTICTEDCPFCDCSPEGACPCENCQDVWCDSWSSIWCTDCVWTSAFSPPIGNPGGSNSCNIVSTNKPYTYRVDLHGIYGGYTGFSNRILNGTSYGCPTGAACGNGDSIMGGCDPDNARPYIRRYHKSPVQQSVGGITGFGVDYACLSWTSDKKTRVMAISGRNVYRYSGFLSGGDTASNWGTQDQTHQCTADAYVTRYYPWIKNGGLTTWVDPTASYNPIGISGIAEMETSLGRQFPLPDSVSGLPLWGQPLAGSFNQGNGDTIDPQCGATHACYGCQCLTASNGTIGHYDARGYTGSQVCFNPQAYVHAYGSYWSRPQQEHTPSGVPLCSVWSFATAMFHFAIHQSQVDFAVEGKDFPPGVNWITQANTWYDNGELDLKLPPARLIRAYRDFLASTPDEILQGWDNGTYYGNAVSWHLEHLAGRINAVGDGVFRVHMPSVFLWDQTPYDSASAGDKYKHMYIIGNANILFDSTCAFPSGLTNGRGPIDTGGFPLPYYETRYPAGANIDEHVWSTDDVRYHILRFDEVNHDNSGARPGVTANSARIIVFPGCSGQTAEFDVGIKKLPAVAVHGDLCVTTPTVDCQIYQIEDASDSPNGIPPMECACAICANLDNQITYDWDPNNTTQQALPACYANPNEWDSNPEENQYFPHPYLITNPTNNKKDCRYFGPLGYLTGLGYFGTYPCRGYNHKDA